MRPDQIAQIAASIPNLAELLDMRIEDGFFIRYGGKRVWLPVSEQDLLQAVRRDGELGEACAEAYLMGDRTRHLQLGQRLRRRTWRKTPHRVRASRLNNAIGSHTAAEWLALLQHHRNRCANCREPGSLEKDHIVPLCAGGSNFAVNLQPLCKRCNSAKSGRIRPGTQLGVFDRVQIRQTQGQAIRRSGR